MKQTTFNKLVLFTAEAYVTRSIEDGLSVDDLHLRLMRGIRRFMILGKFSPKEAKECIEFAADPRLQKIVAQDVSFLVFSLEIMKRWVETVPKAQRKHIHLGISDNELKIGRGMFVIDMLKMKKRDPEKYAELKELIDISVVTAKHWFDFHKEKVNG